MKDPDPITLFVRAKLEEWRSDGKTFTDLAKACGLAQSMISQIHLKSSLVTFYTADKLAVPLGFKNFFDMCRYAELWLEGERIRESFRKPGTTHAIPPPAPVSKPSSKPPSSAPIEETGVRPSGRNHTKK